MAAGPTCEQTAPVTGGELPRVEGFVTHHADRPPVPIDEAVHHPIGEQVLVEGHLERICLGPPVLCTPGHAPPYCTDGGVPVETRWMGEADPDFVSGLPGRFLVRVGDEGFRDVTAIAGNAWYGQPFRGEWELTGELRALGAPDVSGFGMVGTDPGDAWLLVRDDPWDDGGWTAFAPPTRSRSSAAAR